VQACVDTATSTAWLMHGSSVVAGPLVVSLGGPGHPTPRGTFAVAWKDQVHTSSTYGIPMPWSVFFAPGGIAFHEGDVRSASHGCVHLRHEDAVLVFSRLARGDAVRVL
jgi:lipoprotein-anchoring transpeptidase ErfK/SrfK